MEGNRIPKRVLYMNLEITRPRGRPRKRRQDEVREDGRIVGGEEPKNGKESSPSAHANGMNESMNEKNVWAAIAKLV
jgi:hypothetical protein